MLFVVGSHTLVSLFGSLYTIETQMKERILVSLQMYCTKNYKGDSQCVILVLE